MTDDEKNLLEEEGKELTHRLITVRMKLFSLYDEQTVLSKQIEVFEREIKFIKTKLDLIDFKLDEWIDDD